MTWHMRWFHAHTLLEHQIGSVKLLVAHERQSVLIPSVELLERVLHSHLELVHEDIIRAVVAQIVDEQVQAIN